MLARVAENLFWLGRYLERADNIARLADVQFRTNLERTARRGTQAWDAVIAALGTDAAYHRALSADPELCPEAFVVTSAEHPTSLRATVARARGIARELREQLPREVFEELNSLYLCPERSSDLELQQYCAIVKRSLAAVRGLYTYAELRSEGTHWFHGGLAIEGADMMTRLVDTKYFVLLPSSGDVGGPLDHFQWATVLRSVSALEAYYQRYTESPSADRVVQLLLFDPEFPRSFMGCIRRLRAEVARLPLGESVHASAIQPRVEGLIDDLRSTDATHAIENGLHEFVQHCQFELRSVQDALESAYFSRALMDAIAA